MQLEHNNQPKINLKKKKLKLTKSNKNFNIKINKKYSKTKLVLIPRQTLTQSLATIPEFKADPHEKTQRKQH